MNKAEEKMIQAANELTVELIRLQKEVIDAQHENIQLRKKIAELEEGRAIRDLEQQAKGVEGFLLDANTDYESLDFKYWSFNNDYTSKYLCDLREQAKQLKEHKDDE